MSCHVKNLSTSWVFYAPTELPSNMSCVSVIPLKGAMTNEIFQINWPTRNGCEVINVLVRLYGKGVEVFFDRKEEVQTFECMSKHGQGPRLLSRFTSDRVEEFIHARKREAPPGEKPEPICTHLRNMIIMPEMIGSIIGVYNGKTFNQVEIKPEMIGHYLAEFSISYKPVDWKEIDMKLLHYICPFSLD
ncbi:hypothetical protein Fmac_016682 [Flemingia macrophylla]|uniref:40S ribosomal protein S15 n=1 Tax=Flemingia macrophylla TaxID=520843 RepID=A0ABD1MI36_9FABA